MTDDEILFDLLTVEGHMEQVRSEVKTSESEWEEPRAPRAAMNVLPGMQPGQQTSTMRITADREEFIQWFEAEVGPWQQAI